MRKEDICRLPFFAESWNVAWRKAKPGTILYDKDTPFNVIKNSFRYWAADPFIVEKNGEVYIFAELYDYFYRKGILGCCKLKDGKATKWVPIIKEPFHLSYPCIIEYKNKIYIMPESSADKKLILYEALEFPYKWKKCKTLRTNVSFVDTTPIDLEKRRLCIAHQIEKPEHPELILIDLENEQDDINLKKDSQLESRPAGKTFVFQEKHIRPAQNSLDCGVGYGKNLIFYSYELDEQMNYREIMYKEVQPTDLKYSVDLVLDGMHTYNSSDQYEIIDIKTRRFNILNFFMRILNKFLR